MKIAVTPALLPISKLVESICGPLLTRREAELFDYCQALGEVYVGSVDGDFVCCWGLIPPSFLSTQAYLWMWAPYPIKHQFVFIRQSQLHIEAMLRKYDEIVGHCRSEAKSAQRWLRWLGAEFGPENDGVFPFVIRRANG